MPRDIVSPYIGPRRDPDTGRQMDRPRTGRRRRKTTAAKRSGSRRLR
jgi:hypothetical protein